MTDADDTNMNVPDVFRPPLAPEDQPVVKRLNRLYGVVLLFVFLAAGVFAVLFWQDTIGRAQLDKVKQEHREVLEAEGSRVRLFAARYGALETSLSALEKEAASLDALRKSYDKYDWNKALTPAQSKALETGLRPRSWIEDAQRERRELCAQSASCAPVAAAAPAGAN
jgi:hypothetical protein